MSAEAGQPLSPLRSSFLNCPCLRRGPGNVWPGGRVSPPRPALRPFPLQAPSTSPAAPSSACLTSCCCCRRAASCEPPPGQATASCCSDGSAQATSSVAASTESLRAALAPHPPTCLPPLFRTCPHRYFGAAATAVDYFTQAGFSCPPQFNPGDYLIDVTSMDYRSPTAEATTRRRIQLLGDLYQQQGAATAVRAARDRGAAQAVELACWRTLPRSDAAAWRGLPCVGPPVTLASLHPAADVPTRQGRPLTPSHLRRVSPPPSRKRSPRQRLTRRAGAPSGWPTTTSSLPTTC